MREALEQIDEISTLPQVALRVVEVANDQNAGADELTHAMEGDAALSARILRYVNSSKVGLQSRITNLHQALAFIGTQQVRQMALTASISDLFRNTEPIGPYQRENLWRHLVAVGLCARMLANKLGLRNGDDMFLAGLLHDIGIILEDQYFHEGFIRVIESLEEGKTLAAVERQCLGFSHIDLGKRIAEKWQFPDLVKDAIVYHHTMMSYSGESQDVLRCLEVANVLCTVKGYSSVGINLVKLSRTTLPGLGLDRDDLRVLSEELDEELKRNAAMMRV
jgi:putative nucleotidyltransferase with HDIG domain